MGAVEAGSVGVASGINNAASRVASLVAVAALGIVFAQVFDRALDERLQRMTLPASVRESVYEQRHKLAAIEVPANAAPAAQAAARQAVAESFVLGFRWAMGLSALLALAAAASAWLLIGRDHAIARVPSASSPPKSG
jgi:cytochrome c biogenesis protein CcdA